MHTDLDRRLARAGVAGRGEGDGLKRPPRLAMSPAAVADQHAASGEGVRLGC